MSKSAVSQVIQCQYLQEKKQEHSYCFDQNEDIFTIQVARNFSDKLEAYGLVYDIYREKGFIKKNEYQRWYSIFDASLSTTTIVVKKGAEIVGCLTMIFDSKLGLPADELFKDEVDTQRLSSQKIVEIVSLGIKKEIRGARKIFKKLFDINLYFSYFFHGAEDCIITVNPSHVSFYEKKMKYQRLSEHRSYDKVNGAPAVLMQINGKEIIEDKDSDFFKDFDCDKISKVFNFSTNQHQLSEEIFLKYFGARSDFFEKNTYQRVNYFKEMYPDLAFNGKCWSPVKYEYSFS